MFVCVCVRTEHTPGIYEFVFINWTLIQVKTLLSFFGYAKTDVPLLVGN